VRQHAQEHKHLWEKHGRWQDFVAWKSLEGRLSKEEFIRWKQSSIPKDYCGTSEHRKRLVNAWKRRKQKGLGTPWNKGKTKKTSSQVAKNAESLRKTLLSGSAPTIGDYMRGKRFSKEHRRKLSVKAQNRKRRTCPHCAKKDLVPGMYARWHGDNCKFA
jgi:hypothetical protein